MENMTEHRPYRATRHDYIPAAGRDALLPGYDLLTRLLGMNRAYDTLIAQAELADGLRVLEIGCGTGNVTVRAKRANPGAELTGTDPDPRALVRAQRKAQGLTRNSIRARLCPRAAVRRRRIRSRAVVNDAAPLGRRRESRRGSRDSPCFASRRHIAHCRHRWAHDGPRRVRGAAHDA